MAERILTAMYDTRSAAEAARDRLVALGIPSDGITIRGTGAGTTATTAPAAEEDKGFLASLADLFAPEEDRYTYAEGLRRGGYLLSVRVPDGMEDRASDVLEQSGAVDVDERTESWRQSGWTGYHAGTEAAGMSSTERAGGAATTAGYAGTERTAATGGELRAERVGEGEEAIPVVEEQVRVGKREVGGGRVRVRSYVVERPVEEQVSLRQERVDIERRPVDRPVQPGDEVFKEKEIAATERSEEAVVSKEARVVEEVGLRKDVDTRTETVRDTVRKTEVEVEDERADRGTTSTERVTTERDRTGR